MGNTLAHFHHKDELQRVLYGFAGILNMGGVCVIQLLNYARIITKKPRIVSRKTVDGTTFVRYYAYHGDTVIFKILTCRNEPGAAIRTLDSITLTPIYPKQISELLRGIGFKVALFGGIDFSPYDEFESKDLLIVAQLENIHG
jgi:hypothetical protein